MPELEATGAAEIVGTAAPYPVSADEPRATIELAAADEAAEGAVDETAEETADETADETAEETADEIAEEETAPLPESPN